MDERGSTGKSFWAVRRVALAGDEDASVWEAVHQCYCLESKTLSLESEHDGNSISIVK